MLTSTASLTGEVNLLATAWGRVAAQAKSAALEQARAVYAQSTQNIIKAGEAYNAKRDAGFRAAAVRPFAERGLSRDAPVINGPQALAAGERAAANAQAASGRLTLTQVETAIDESFDQFSKCSRGDDATVSVRALVAPGPT